MRVLVCGGRGFKDYEKLEQFMNMLHAQLNIDTVIHGVATGADTLAGKWAKNRTIRVEEYPADWANEGFAAGPRRNKRMLAEGKPDLVVAFPGGKGTAHMVKIAKQAKVRVVDLRSKDDD
jgi:hypothetical protein